MSDFNIYCNSCDFCDSQSRFVLRITYYKYLTSSLQLFGESKSNYILNEPKEFKNMVSKSNETLIDCISK